MVPQKEKKHTRTIYYIFEAWYTIFDYHTKNNNTKKKKKKHMGMPVVIISDAPSVFFSNTGRLSVDSPHPDVFWAYRFLEVKDWIV